MHPCKEHHTPYSMAEDIGMNRHLSVQANLDLLLPYMAGHIRSKYPELSTIDTSSFDKRLMEETIKRASGPPGSLERALKNNEKRVDVDGKLQPLFDWPIHAAYDAEDILALGYLPHSCTSYALLAKGLLDVVEAQSRVIFLYDEASRRSHSIIETAIGLRDPKWHCKEEYRKADPLMRRRFENGEFIHVVRGTTYGHSIVIKH